MSRSKRPSDTNIEASNNLENDEHLMKLYDWIYIYNFTVYQLREFWVIKAHYRIIIMIFCVKLAH